MTAVRNTKGSDGMRWGERTAAGLALAAFCAALPMSAPASAAETGITGMWMVRHEDFKVSDPPPYTQAAKDYAEAHKDVVMTSEGKKCLPYGMPAMMYNELALEIVESPERIAMISEQTELPRTVYLNTKTHPDPADVAPSWNGHSIGHWEGKTLVVDTANLNDRVSHVFFFAMPSKSTKILEKFHLEDAGQTLAVEMTITDPAVLTKPWVRKYAYHRMPAGSEVWEYVCDPDDPGWSTSLGGSAATGK
jgi:hypothetical protein